MFPSPRMQGEMLPLRKKRQASTVSSSLSGKCIWFQVDCPESPREVCWETGSRSCASPFPRWGSVVWEGAWRCQEILSLEGDLQVTGAATPWGQCCLAQQTCTHSPRRNHHPSGQFL